MCIRDSGWSAMLYDVASGEYCFSKKYDLHIIDRVGGGDSLDVYKRQAEEHFKEVQAAYDAITKGDTGPQMGGNPYGGYQQQGYNRQGLSLIHI